MFSILNLYLFKKLEKKTFRMDKARRMEEGQKRRQLELTSQPTNYQSASMHEKYYLPLIFCLLQHTHAHSFNEMHH